MDLLIQNVFLGTVFEYLIKNKYNEQRYLTFRCSGSKPFDLLIIKEGYIYIHLCDLIKEIKPILRVLSTDGYAIIKQAGHNEYLAIKNGTILLLMVENLIDVRVTNEIREFGIRVINVENIDIDFLNLSTYEKCAIFSIVECKASGIINKKQFTNLLKLGKIMGCEILYVLKTGSKAMEHFYTSAGKRLFVAEL